MQSLREELTAVRFRMRQSVNLLLVDEEVVKSAEHHHDHGVS